MRVQLDAINGDPNLFMRMEGIPTLSHDPNGAAGGIFDRSMTGQNTEYANWVPFDGRTEQFLTSGAWYFCVRAEGASNVRYRLRISTGAIKELPVNGLTNQALVAGDWSYYKVQIPEDAPAAWNIHFAEQSGDVTMFLRDTVPPGNPGFSDWSTDAKNQGPYPSFDSPGNHPLTTPPLRPGTVYYLGVFAHSDATVDVSYTFTGGTAGLPPLVAYDTGTISTTLAAGASSSYRVAVPGDALRFRYTATHDPEVEIRIEQGTFPSSAGSVHFSTNGGADSFFDQLLGQWPWVAGQAYHVRIINHAATSQPVSLLFGGTNTPPGGADDDSDSLPDEWETLHFGNLNQPPLGDFDHDGLSNLMELALGLDPTDSTGVFPLPADEDGYLTMTIAKPEGVTGITYTVQVTGDLNNPDAWTTDGTTILVETLTVLKVRETQPIGGGPPRFMRLMVRR